jgi:osmotically-inducible protein OsmY
MSYSRRFSLVSALLALALCCLGFTYAKPGEDEGGRSLGSMSKDQALANTIKGKLLDKDKVLGLKVRVACYDGRAFLVGRVADHAFQVYAVHAARETKGVAQITAVFEKNTAAEDKDKEVTARVREALSNDPDLGSLGLEVEVLDGEAVLLGKVPDTRLRKQAEAAASSVPGVAQVRSLLLTGK